MLSVGCLEVRSEGGNLRGHERRKGRRRGAHQRSGRTIHQWRWIPGKNRSLRRNRIVEKNLTSGDAIIDGHLRRVHGGNWHIKQSRTPAEHERPAVSDRIGKPRRGEKSCVSVGIFPEGGYNGLVTRLPG